MNTLAVVNDGRLDFDFFMGTWTIENRKILKILQGCTEWEHFTATCRARPLPGGIGNMDEFIAEAWRPGFVGMTLRLFNPATQQWSLYWVDNRSGELQPPVVGAFRGDIGIFEGPDVYEGKPIRVRFTWTRRGPDVVRWEQAFSPDDGATWEANWVMDSTRIPESRA